VRQPRAVGEEESVIGQRDTRAWLVVVWSVHDYYAHPALADREAELRAMESRLETYFAGDCPGLEMWVRANYLTDLTFRLEIYADGMDGAASPRPFMYQGGLEVPIVLPRPNAELSALELEEAARTAIVETVDVLARRRGWGAIPWDGELPPEGIVTKRRPMSDVTRERALSRLWTVLESAGAAPDRPASELLPIVAETLNAAGAGACDEFVAGMHLALFALDLEELFRTPVRDRGESLDQPPIPLSDDTFLYARCAVLLSGRETYESVLRDPRLFAATWDMDSAGLLELPDEFMDELDVQPQIPAGLPSYETGSNSAHWSTRA
jgi:hypothetical protein